MMPWVNNETKNGPLAPFLTPSPKAAIIASPLLSLNGPNPKAIKLLIQWAEA